MPYLVLLFAMFTLLLHLKKEKTGTCVSLPFYTTAKRKRYYFN